MNRKALEEYLQRVQEPMVEDEFGGDEQWDDLSQLWQGV